MGCSINRSIEELSIKEIWDETVICQTQFEEFLKRVNEIINTITRKQSENGISEDEVPGSIFQTIIDEFIKIDPIKLTPEKATIDVNLIDYVELFEKIRFHLVKEDKQHKMGYLNIFSLGLMTKASKSDKILYLIELFSILEKIYKIKGNIKITINLFKSIMISYIDLVSFSTLGYFLKINLNRKDRNFLEKYEKIYNCFRVDNRTKLIKKYFEKWENSKLFSLDEFIQEKNDILDQSSIRDQLIEMDHGLEGLYIDQENLKKGISVQKEKNEHTPQGEDGEDNKREENKVNDSGRRKSGIIKRTIMKKKSLKQQ